MTVLGSRYSLRVGNVTRCRLLAELMKHGESNAVVESEYSTSGTCVSVFSWLAFPTNRSSPSFVFVSCPTTTYMY